jgi:glycerate-2-kinase
VIALIIKNFPELATTNLRKDILEMLNAGIESLLPESLLRANIAYDENQDVFTVKNKDFSLKNKRLFVIGFGKASAGMAKSIEQIISAKRITAGLVITDQINESLSTIELFEANHPIPDQRCVDGTRRILELKEQFSINNNDIILCLISGGGSSLLTYPIDTITLEHLKQINKLLLASGADITEINMIRKHLSQVKGGRLGEYFKPANIVSLIISDIIRNPLDAIASGPTVPDPTTFKDVFEVLIKYNLLEKIPKQIRTYIESDLNSTENETPIKLENCYNFVIGDNQVALDTMFEKAEALGYEPLIVSSQLSGEPGFEAKKRAHYIKIGKYSDYDVLLLAGETTPVLPEHHGSGGRNQHYILSSMMQMKEFNGDWVIASVSTDGADYLKDVAGAIIDDRSFNASMEKGLDVEECLEIYDSNTFFKELGSSLVVTGKTGTNVGDLIVYILKNSR